MPTVDTSLSAKSLAEVALLAARVGRDVIDERAEPSSTSLRGFWQSTRSLQRYWMQQLDDWSTASDPELTQLADLGAQLFTCEMAARVWSTVLAGVDRQYGRDDLTRIARNTIAGLLQIRHGVMSRLLQQPVSLEPRVAAIERLRRRCDRWTDLLIGNLSGRHNLFEFAFDPERAKDFSTETMEYDPSTGPHPVEHLVTVGLRLAFLGQLPASPLTEPAFASMVQSILAGLPQQAFHRDGSLRSLLERRIAPNVQRDDRRTSVAPAGGAMDDDLLLGISFAKLRRRPK